jgi:chromosome segregation ATPase
MRKQILPRPSKRKAKVCAACESWRNSRKQMQHSYDLVCEEVLEVSSIVAVLSHALEKANFYIEGADLEMGRFKAERDTARKELAQAQEQIKAKERVDTDRCIEINALRKELAEANQALEQYVQSYATYRGRIMDADRQAAEREYWMLKTQRRALEPARTTQRI